MREFRTSLLFYLRGQCLSLLIKVRVSTSLQQKKGSLSSQSGRDRTGKYCDGAQAVKPVQTKAAPCGINRRANGGPPEPTDSCTWRSLCHQGKYEELIKEQASFILVRERTDHMHCMACFECGCVAKKGRLSHVGINALRESASQSL